MDQIYNNKSLFSDYYLEELAGEDSHWQTLRKSAWEFHQRIANILEKAVPGINGDTPEAEVERRLIRPILDALGHVYFVQPMVPSSEGIRRPDYALFPSPEARQEAESHKGQLEFFKTALAVGDAKAWERSLDRRVKGPGDPFTNHNPSYQIDFYLRATDKRWGLLTNGRHWRLYHRDLSYRLDVYYEVDLPQIITLDEDAFLYFLAFFHKEAFQPDGTGECFLDRAYRASTEYAAKVSEELKDNVYEALRLLAEGFLSFPGNSLKPEDLDLVRENAFIAIYRLLFILYAEAREFLPAANPSYLGTYSLRALTHEIATKEPFESNLSPVTTGYWSRLRDLFTLINTGDDFLQIPPYNGRLFDDQKEHKSLATWRIGDRYLAAAIDQLARASAAGRTGRGFVSYRDLSIRELGSIYEGLLEHRPRYATQDAAVVKDDKREKFIPLAELGSRKALKTYQSDSVYLETDKGERKTTGSYYTPQYIVEHIVSNTLGPLLEEAKQSDNNLIDAILSLKVLDPAMGSGHFLVEATDYLARALVEALGGDPREMEEDEIRWARREVVERCIYGVDLNPLAVDLAKLSLWLSTVSLDKPLNFLDHHLRCGNSLIGASLEDLGQLPVLTKKAAKAAPASQSLLEYYFHQNVATAVDNYFRIAAISSDKLQDIQEKENLYGIARDILKRYREVAHLWTSAYFGNEVPAEGYMALQDKIRATDPEWVELEKQPWFVKGVKIGEDERRFFHWELEFPEIFFDRNGQRLQNPGFSAVVGNPPWALEQDEVLKGYYLEAFDTVSGKPDIYRAFIERSVSLTKVAGFHSFVSPNTFLSIPAGRKLRELLLGRYQPISFVLVSMGAFPDVAANIVIYVFRNREIPSGAEVAVYDWSITVTDEASRIVDPFGWTHSHNKQIDLYATREIGTVIRKTERVSVPLHFHFEYVLGLQVYHNTVHSKEEIANRIFHAGTQLDPSFRPEIGGRHLVRYGCNMEDFEWVKVTERCYLCPAARFFEGPRVLLREISDERGLVGGFCDVPCFSNKSTIIVRKLADSLYGLGYLLGIVNSSLIGFYFHLTSAKSQQELFPRLSLTSTRDLPIRRINFTTPKVERQRLVKEGKNLYQEFLQTKDWDKVLSFAGERLPQKPDGSPDTEREQSDVVHDLLTFLAEEMTRLHKEKQAEIKGFLTWLESYLGVSVDNLRNKTKVKEYWKAEVAWEGFLSALEQNRRSIQSAKGIDVTRREPEEAIRAEFETSVAKLRPLLERIELTDKLIDQIVYKLYGLTEEEIAIVKGQG